MYTGAVQTYVATSPTLNVQVCGGSGTAIGPSAGGLGGCITTTVSVTVGQTLYMYVGGSSSGATGGFNGGSDTDTSCDFYLFCLI